MYTNLIPESSARKGKPKNCPMVSLNWRGRTKEYRDIKAARVCSAQYQREESSIEKTSEILKGFPVRVGEENYLWVTKAAKSAYIQWSDKKT